MKYWHWIMMSWAILVTTQVNAQDIHFSQYYHSPLTLSPAMTANFNGLVRASINHRSQWWKIGSTNALSPYQTFSGSVDAPLFESRASVTLDRLGAGLMVYSDKAGDGALTTNVAQLSLAYHKSIDGLQNHVLSVGFQGGVVQKRVDLTQLFFETQLDGFGFNPDKFNGEVSYTTDPIMYPDFNLGVLWQSQPFDRVKYYVGFNIFHLLEPNETFLQDVNNTLSRRYTWNLGAEFELSRYSRFIPAMIYMLQSNAQQINIGGAYSYDYTSEWEVFGGVWTRINTTTNIDAVILSVGGQYLNYRGGLSYDINVSDLAEATKTQGSIEASFIYIYGSGDNGKIERERYCPRF